MRLNLTTPKVFCQRDETMKSACSRLNYWRLTERKEASNRQTSLSGTNWNSAEHWPRRGESQDETNNYRI
ncbi:hypothetical protein A6V32_18275 [Proteus mirabilis]|nr:hypothetical protein A6V32_18275 [Proteus mirabilis]